MREYGYSGYRKTLSTKPDTAGGLSFASPDSRNAGKAVEGMG